MIVTVTMNPAIDKTVDIDSLEQGGLNRIRHVELDAGGKGINVSKTIRELGGESVATGFLAGNAGDVIEKVLKDCNIRTDFIRVSGETRTNLKVVETSGEVTELNEPGPVVEEEEVEAILTKLDKYAAEDTLFVLAGSIPSGVERDIYRRIIDRVHQKGAKVLLDADGELFKNALGACPDLMKPNRVELEEYFKLEYRSSEEDLKRMGGELLNKGAELVAVSLGQLGAMFLTKEGTFRCPGLSVKAHSTVGAGDAMVAALAYSLDKKLSMEECVKLCMATSAGAVTTIGTKPPKREAVEKLMEQVEIIRS